MSDMPCFGQVWLDAPPKRRRALISLTPLIDVVFILLIFFMLASSFLTWTPMPLSVPGPQAGSPDDCGRILVQVNADGTIALDGQPWAIGELTAGLRERLATRADDSVLVRPAADLPLQSLVDVLDAVRLAEPGAMSLSR